MKQYSLSLQNGHIYLKLDAGYWLFDTGAPNSFGSEPSIAIEGVDIGISSSYMGMDLSTLQQSLGIECKGLLGADVLSEFDFLLDLQDEVAIISKGQIQHDGIDTTMEEFMGIPIVSVIIEEQPFNMFFDTGAQISYLQDDLLETFPEVGTFRDFYPGFGEFDTDTYQVGLAIEGLDFSLKCGKLPLLLGMTLAMGETHGIVGNEILRTRKIGYFPRRGLITL